MDTGEARRVLSEKLALYRPLSYSELVGRIDTIETVEISRSEGLPWQLEFQFFWDTDPGGNVRVGGSIDDGGLRAFFPVSDSFIKSPSGEFVGE
jgi:hypothetical protein